MANFIYLSLLKGVSFLFPLITLPYLAKVIGPDSFGAIAFASAIMVIVETITDWGFNFTATRDVAVNRADTSIVSNIYSQVLYARLFLTLLCFIGLLIVANCIPSLEEYKTLLIITFLYIPGNILFPQWLFQAFEKMRYITILTLLSKCIFTALVFIVIKKQSDYIYEPALTACGFMFSGLIAQYIIYKNFRIRLEAPHPRQIRDMLKRSTDMFISLLLPNLYTNFTVIILKTYCGELATGIYNGGQRFQSIVDNLTSILSRTFFPFLARHKEKHHIYVMISGSIAVFASLLMFFGAQLFVDIFLTSEFQDAVTVMKIFAITPIFLFLMNTYGTNYLVIIGKENILRNIILIVSILGFALTWILTPKFSYIGASITVTVIWGIRGIATYFFAKKEKLKY
ncbi:MAG: flippase [Muribaculaceae bacterium]|nr:flippase [Muribaculaceae bacterium]